MSLDLHWEHQLAVHSRGSSDSLLLLFLAVPVFAITIGLIVMSSATLFTLLMCVDCSWRTEQFVTFCCLSL